ncbi:MAG: LPP20 family lipoprotein [SAR324 cluster bacterium]|nr:LPP20 family lipoprotein [SAR324 cluster bacterium]
MSYRTISGKGIILGLCLLTFISCSTNKAKRPTFNKEEVPNWFLQQIHFEKVNNSLYGYGASDNLVTAKNNAIADISSFLLVKVSSKTRAKEEINRSKGDITITSQFSQQVITQSRPIILSGAEIIKNKQINGRFFVQIEISASHLSTTLKKIVSDTNDKLTVLIATTESTPNMSDLVNMAKLDFALDDSDVSLVILKSLSNLEGQSFLNGAELSNLDASHQTLKHNYLSMFSDTYVVIKIVNHDLAHLAGIIKETLTQSGLRVSIDNQTSSIGNQVPTGFIILDGKLSESDFQNAKIADVSLQITLTDKKRIDLATKQYALRGISAISSNDASLKAVHRWAKMLPNKNLIVDIISP